MFQSKKQAALHSSVFLIEDKKGGNKDSMLSLTITALVSGHEAYNK
jgi:hypothetical protein